MPTGPLHPKHEPQLARGCGDVSRLHARRFVLDGGNAEPHQSDRVSSSRTSRPSPRSTSTDTFVSSRMPTLRGVLAALDSFSHCAKI